MNDYRIERFKEEVEKIGGRAWIAKDMEDAKSKVISVLRRENTKKVILWESRLLKDMDLFHILETEQIQSILPSQIYKGDRKALFNELSEADTGITECLYGISENGSVVLESRKGMERITSLIPPHHIAILPSSRIVESINEVFKDKRCVDSCMTFISGPSKTADIELTLILGIHGPKSLDIIIAKEG